MTTALTTVGDDPGLTAARAPAGPPAPGPDPTGFDTHWTKATGQQPPDWLLVDPELLAAAQGWVDTDTYTAERDWLTNHPELLDPAADTAIDEALLPLPDNEAARYRALRAAARTSGVQAAYRPLLLQLLAHNFARADTTGQRALLTNQGDDLRTDDRHRNPRHPPRPRRRPQARVAGAMPDRPVHHRRAQTRRWTPWTRAPTGWPGCCSTPQHRRPRHPARARRPGLHRGHHTRRCRPRGAVHRRRGTAHPDPDTDQALHAVTQARTLAPGHENQWITQLAPLAAHQPTVLQRIIPMLTAPQPEENQG